MLLTEKRLRALIHDILLEGVREDAAALEAMLKDNPEALRQFQSLTTKPKWVNWLADRYLRQKYPVDDTLPDVLPLVVNFASKDAAISQKYKENEQFKTAVDTAFPPESRGWQNPADATKMTSSDLNTLIVLHNRKKQRIEVDRADESWKIDKIGQFGPWALYFPTSQQNSVNIAGADPVTLKGYTTWCTARTAGSNLFYSYAGHGIMLFYAIDEDKPPTDPKGRISLGYEEGELNTSGEYGGVTVDAENNGLKMPALKKIFGRHLSGILAAAEAVVAHHGEEHPAKAEFNVARQDAAKFKSMLSGLSDDEAGDLCGSIIESGDLSAEVALAAASHKSAGVRLWVTSLIETPPHVLEKLASDADVSVRTSVARNQKIPPHVLEKLAGDASASVRGNVADNKSTPSHVLEKLTGDSSKDVRGSVAYNRSTPPHILEKLAVDTDVGVRKRVAQNRSTPPHILEKLAGDSDESVRQEVISNESTPSHVLLKMDDDDNVIVRRLVAGHHSTPPHVLVKMASDPDASVRGNVAVNASTPLHIVEKMAADPEELVRQQVAHNQKIPPHVLEKLAGDPEEYVRVYVASNVATLPHILEKLAADPEEIVRQQVAFNRKTPPHVLEKLASDTKDRVRAQVAFNQKTPSHVLEKLAADPDELVRAGATQRKQQPMGEARRLAHRIIAELKRR